MGIHTVQLVGGEEQARLSLGMVSHAGGSAGLDGGAGGGAGVFTRVHSVWAVPPHHHSSNSSAWVLPRPCRET